MTPRFRSSADRVAAGMPGGVTRRRVIASAGGATLALPLAAACGAGGSDQAGNAAAVPITISFGTKWVTQAARLEALNLALPLFMQHYPKIMVELHGITGDNAATIETMYASGSPDDVVLLNGNQFARLRDSGAFVDLSPLIKADKIDIKKYTLSDPVFLSGNKRFAMPFQLVVNLFFINKTLFKQEGVALPTEQWTWNDWADAARRLTKPEKNQYGIGGALGTNIQNELVWALASNGTHYISPDFKRTLLSEPPALEAIQWLSDRINRDRSWVAPGVSGVSISNGNLAISKTDAGSIGSLTSGNTKDLTAKFDWDLFLQPKAPRTGKAITNYDEQPHVVSARSGSSAARVDAAFKFAVYMAGKDVQLLIAAARGSIPVYRELMTTSPYTDSPPASMSLVAKWVDSAADKRFFPAFVEWHDAVSKEIANIWTGKVSPETGAKNATDVGNGILAKTAAK